MKSNCIIIALYATILLIGGTIGYVQTQSLASIIAGTISFILLIGSSILMLQKEKLGYVFAISLVCFLACFFSYRYALTQKFMPAGIMIILSALTGMALLWTSPYRKRIRD